MHRFLCPNQSLTSKTVSITEEKEIHHLKNVLRLKKGDDVRIFNGIGGEAVASISEIQNDCVSLMITHRLSQKEGKNTFITLACAIPKNAKFETIIEKCTELGVDEIIPLKTQRTEVIIKADKLEKKISRYQTVAVNAAKQSKRSVIPNIQEVASFKDFLKTLDKNSIAYIPHLNGQRKALPEALKKAAGYKRVLFLIGPEGDFTPAEVSLALKAGCIPVSLGENTLKVDTAAIAVVAFANLTLS